MIEQLRRIVQEVNSAQDLQNALDIIVRRVREALDTHVCSVFLLDNDLKDSDTLKQIDPFTYVEREQLLSDEE